MSGVGYLAELAGNNDCCGYGWSCRSLSEKLGEEELIPNLSSCDSRLIPKKKGEPLLFDLQDVRSLPVKRIDNKTQSLAVNSSWLL